MSMVIVNNDIPTENINIESNKNVTLSSNTEEILPSNNYDALAKVTVTAPIAEAREASIYVNDGQFPLSGLYTVDRPIYVPQGYLGQGTITGKFKLKDETFTSNGTYYIENNRDTSIMLGWYKLNINVPSSGTPINNYQFSGNITTNGTHTIPNGYTGFDNFTVSVPTVNNQDVTPNNIITSNGTAELDPGYTGFNEFTVALPIYEQTNSVLINPPNSYVPTDHHVYAINVSQTISPPANYDYQTDVQPYFQLEKLFVNTNGTFTFNPANKTYSNSLGWYEVDVTVPTVNNKDVDSSNNNIITTNGTYTIPNGYTGWNNFVVNVPTSQLLTQEVVFVTFIDIDSPTSASHTMYLSSFTYQSASTSLSLLQNQIAINIYKSTVSQQYNKYCVYACCDAYGNNTYFPVEADSYLLVSENFTLPSSSCRMIFQTQGRETVFESTFLSSGYQSFNVCNWKNLGM